jgi:hypothetical protein
LDIGEIGVSAYPEFLPVAPSAVTAQPEIVPVAASTSVSMLGDGLTVAEANAG